MAITYQPANNKILITGFTSSVPATFTNIYDEDKAGTLNLFSGTPALNITLTTQIKPSDETALKIDFILASSGAGAGDTIDITGTDKDGNAQNETLTTEADGTFTTTKWYKTITDVDCNGFNAGSLTIRQNQWGVVWKLPFLKDYPAMDFADWFRIESPIALDGHLASKNEVIDIVHFDSVFVKKPPFGGNNGYLYIGEKSDDAEKTGKSGSVFRHFGDLIHEPMIKIYAYDSTFISAYSIKTIKTDSTIGEIWNCVFVRESISQPAGELDIINCEFKDSRNIFAYFTTAGELGGIRALDSQYLAQTMLNYGVTLKNVYAREIDTLIFCSSFWGSTYLIDFDSDWTSVWNGDMVANGKIYRQYTLNLKVIDKDNNPIGNATVVLKDKDGNTADQKGFETTTNGDGEIAEQTVSYGYYNQANGNTVQSYSPHTIEIKKAGYQTYKAKFTLDEKINWKIKLHKQVPLVITKSGSSINLDASNSINMLYN